MTAETIGRTELDQWAEPFRRWYYYPDHIITAALENDANFTMVDGPNVYYHEGRWHMLYFGYDGNGYQSCLAMSDDLIHWTPAGIVMGYGSQGAFDYGGVVLVGPLLTTHDAKEIPRLKRWRDRYWILYGCYPQQGGYELGSGGQGLAWSEDGYTWYRYSGSEPVLSTAEAADWENSVIYSPWLVSHAGQFWNFYNAKGVENREQIGVATSEDLIHWKRYTANPVLGNDLGGYDAIMAADPKVYRHENYWMMFYFGASNKSKDKKLHAHVMMAFSRDLIHWQKHPEPIVMAGGHPEGLDGTHAHNVSLIYERNTDTFYMYYCAVGEKGRGIGLLTSRPLE